MRETVLSEALSYVMNYIIFYKLFYIQNYTTLGLIQYHIMHELIARKDTTKP